MRPRNYFCVPASCQEARDVLDSVSKRRTDPMDFPRVEVLSDDSIDQADERVEKAYEDAGAEFVAFENLNSSLGHAGHCHFFHAVLDDRPAVVVVATGEWDEETTITALNVLLELRLDPDPPGSQPQFRFHSHEAVPEILTLLFGDSPLSELEWRACLVARFGHELSASASQQLATVACYLSRSVFGVELALGDDSLDGIASVVCERLAAAHPPAEPLNALILYGCLFGECLRAIVDRPSRWLRVRQFDPWPALVFANSSPDEDVDAGSQTADQIAFSPIAHVIHLYQTGERDALKIAADGLKAKCQ